MEERGLGLADQVSERISRAADAIAEKTGKVDDILKSRIAEIDKSLVASAGEIARALGERSAEMKSVLSGEGEMLVAAIGERGKELSARISEVAGTLERSLGTSADRAVGSLREASDTLRADATEILGRLGQANELLNTIMHGASNTLVRVETDITGRMKEVVDTLTDLASGTDRLTGDVSARIESIREVAGAALHDANEIALSLEGRTKAMIEATHLLSTAQTRINETLEDKQQALGQMVDEVSNRAQNLEAIIRSFTSLVDETMRNAETRARQVGSVLAEQSQLTVDAITDQYETVRTEGAREHERTVASLREAYEEALSQTGALYSGLGKGFKESVDELRGATARIRQELDAARAELKRGAAELPREAEATTAAVRRIVSDQVKALSELTEIVNRANRGLDVSEPRKTPAREPRAELRRAPAEPAIERTSRAGRERNGWLSELLSRASDEPAPLPVAARTTRERAPAPRAPEPAGLDAIVNEIGRMIDEGQMLDAWDRYRRGERSAFGRRLYTTLGQQTFDEIRRRYRRDGEFRENVDSVVDQFDRQLRDVTASDRSGAEADRFLASDAGKVYTLLAHASGRLD